MGPGTHSTEFTGYSNDKRYMSQKLPFLDMDYKSTLQLSTNSIWNPLWILYPFIGLSITS